jgi:DNA-directed RNA polymerase subunit RPC12/RpoP
MSDLRCPYCESENVEKAINGDTGVEDCYVCMDCRDAWPLEGDDSGDGFILCFEDEEDTPEFKELLEKLSS